MPIFRYEATDRQGILRRGAMEAPDAPSVRKRLAEMGYTPQAVAASENPERPTEKSSNAGRQPPRPTSSPRLLFSGLPLRDEFFFWNQLAELSASGLNPFDCFQSLGSRAANPRIRNAALDVAGRVKSGSTVADAMEHAPDVLGTKYIPAIRAGELGGVLPGVYREISADIEREIRLAEMWKWLRWYHNFSLAAGIVLLHFMLFMSGYLADKLDPNSLPESSAYYAMLFEGLSLWKGAFAVQIVLGVFIPFFIIRAVVKRLLLAGVFRSAVDRSLLVIPVIGGYRKVKSLGMFYGMLGKLLRAGVSPVAAWEASARSVQSLLLGKRLEQVSRNLVQGTGYAAAANASGIIPATDIRKLEIAERTGDVPSVLEALRQEYQAKMTDRARIAKMAEMVPEMLAAAIVVGWGLYVALKFSFDIAFKMVAE